MATQFRAISKYDCKMQHSKLLFIGINNRVFRLLSIRRDDSMIIWNITGQGKDADDFGAVHRWLQHEWLPMIGLCEQLRQIPFEVDVDHIYMTSTEAQQEYPLHSMELLRIVTPEERDAPNNVFRSCLYVYQIKFGTIPARIHYDCVPVESISI